MSHELKQQIEQEIAVSQVHLFIKGTPEMPQCGFSKAVCDAFMFLDVPFTTTNVLLDLDNYRSALRESFGVRPAQIDYPDCVFSAAFHRITAPGTGSGIPNMTRLARSP